MKKAVMALCIAALGIGSCKKSEQDIPLAVRLQAHTWRLTAMTYNGAPYQLEDCQLDDLLVYQNGNGYDDRGTVKCGDTDPQRTPFTYTVLPDEHSISVAEAQTPAYYYEAVYCDDQSLRMTRLIQQDTLVISWNAE